MTTIAEPRSPYARSSRSGTNWEKWGWVYMRASGVILVVLIFGHLFVNLMVGEGVKAIDFAFVAGKWATPFWQWWDLAMLWLSMTIQARCAWARFSAEQSTPQPSFSSFWARW